MITYSYDVALGDGPECLAESDVRLVGDVHDLLAPGLGIRQVPAAKKKKEISTGAGCRLGSVRLCVWLVFVLVLILV